MEKYLRQSFLVLSTLTNLREQLKKVLKVFWQVLWKLLDHFCGTYEVVRNTNFENKGNHSSENIGWAFFLSSYWTSQKSWNNLSGCKRFFDK